MERFLQPNGKARTSYILAFVAAISVGAAIYQLIHNVPTAHALDQRGVETTARIVEKFIVDCSVLTKNCQSKNKRIRLEFETTGGETVQVVEPVGKTFFANHKVGDEIGLIYLPDDPNTYRAAVRMVIDPLNLVILFAALAAVMAFLAYQYWETPE